MGTVFFFFRNRDHENQESLGLEPVEGPGRSEPPESETREPTKQDGRQSHLFLLIGLLELSLSCGNMVFLGNIDLRGEKRGIYGGVLVNFQSWTRSSF